MRSFALWYSINNECSSKNKEVKVHVNLWNKGKNNKKEYCFDFGLLVDDISEIENIYLYCPFNLVKSQIEDLGSVISDNKLINAIFNENFTTTDGEPKRLIVNSPLNKPRFIIYSLEVERQVDLRTCKRDSEIPGTIVVIKVNDIKYDALLKYYFRIRITVPNDDIHLINDQIKGVSIFNSHFTNTEVIDFRLNDIRSCSEELREQFNKGEGFKITAVHYLILRNANDVIIHHGKEMTSRMLEDDLWSKYIKDLDYDIIAYHLKSKAKLDNAGNVETYVEDFSALTRFQYEKGTRKILAMYIVGIILFGSIGGVIGNGLTTLLIKLFEKLFN